MYDRPMARWIRISQGIFFVFHLGLLKRFRELHHRLAAHPQCHQLDEVANKHKVPDDFSFRIKFTELN